MAGAATLDSDGSRLIEGPAAAAAAADNDKVPAADDAEDAQETFHDTRESVHSGESSSTTSPTMKGHNGPNTNSEAGFTHGELTEDTTNEELDPTPRPPDLSSWDQSIYSSQMRETTPFAPGPTLSLATAPMIPRSPNNGANRRRGSIKDQANRQNSRRSVDIKELPASPMKAESPDHGAFWQQLKLKFGKRTAKDASQLSPALPLPPPDTTGHISPFAQSPPTSAYKVSLLPMNKQSRDTLPSGIGSALPPGGNHTASANEPGQANEPLFQVLPASTSLRPTTALACPHPVCSARSPLENENPVRHPSNLNRRSLELPLNCQRAPSIRKLKKRSASIRRTSVPVHSYNLTSPAELAEYIYQAYTNQKPTIVLDVRSASMYMNSSRRLHKSMNVNIPSLLVKRFRQGNFASFSLKSFLQDDRSKENYAELCPDDQWQKHQICVVDDAMKETDFLAPNGSSTAAILVSALAAKQAEDAGPSRPIYVLQGSLVDLMEHAFRLSGNLVEEDIKLHSSVKNDYSVAGMASGPLFATPTVMSCTAPSQSIDTALRTARPRETNGGYDSPPVGVMQAPLLPAPALRKLRPLQLQRIDTSRTAKQSDPDAHEPNTPRGLAKSHPHQALSLATSTQAASPAPNLPLSAFVHTGISAPSRLPTIVMPLEGQATPRGGATFQVSVIIPGFLYLGPEPLQEEDVEELESVGIKRILNVATECDTEDRWRGRFEKIASIPMRDSLAEPNVQERFEEACSLLDDADLLERPTYVHCKAGKSRSVTITLAYLIHRNHWPLKRAYAHVLDRRQGVSPNIGFVAELMRFEEAELGGRSRGILGSGSTPAHEKVEYFAGNRNTPAEPIMSDGKTAPPAIPRAARSDLEGRPTVVRHLSFIASTALGINNDKPRTRDQRSSTHVARNRDSMPPGLGYSHYDTSHDKPESDN